MDDIIKKETEQGGVTDAPAPEIGEPGEAAPEIAASAVSEADEVTPDVAETPEIAETPETPSDVVRKRASGAHRARRGKPSAPRQRLGYFRRLALLICIGVLVFSGYNLVLGLLEYKEASDYYDSLGKDFLTTPDSEVPQKTPTPPPIPSSNGELPPPDDFPDEPDEPKPSYVEDYAPDIWPVVDFAGLQSINADNEAWLLCVGTNINYPVVHSHDNTEYLSTMFDGRTSKVGALFIDMRNSRGFTDRNTIIYGHNMRNHSMFWTVTQYKSQSFYNEHPTMRLITETGNYEIQLFAGFVADAAETAVWQVHFASNETYMNWISSLFERSTFKSYVELTSSDRIVTLSTCTYDFTGARYVVMGKLVLVSGEDSKSEVPNGGENSNAESEPPAGTGESAGTPAGTEETPPAE
ncbi:MAG: class B sortase, partial [Oscillospiraceae bacterium]|nr:class B sortase [Oscillospiraceae bacterium]